MPSTPEKENCVTDSKGPLRTTIPAGGESTGTAAAAKLGWVWGEQSKFKGIFFYPEKTLARNTRHNAMRTSERPTTTDCALRNGRPTVGALGRLILAPTTKR